MSQFTRETVLLVLGFLILLGLGWLAVWTYWRSRLGYVTFSDFMRILGFRHPLVAFGIGVVVGLVLGFVAGHLWWPQILED